jgi:hypothetical protein
MFCTQCGKAAAPEHVFCSGCGTRLVREASAAPMGLMGSVSEPAVAPEPAPTWTGEDWRDTLNYRVVLGHPEVKALIADAAKVSKAGMTGDEFLKLAQPILDASGSGGVPMKLIAEIATPLYAKMGVKTGKDAKNGYATSYGRTLAAILCSLASRNQTLVAVHEGTDGCVVQAEIPSSMTTWKGKLSLTLERKAEGTLVSSAVVFEGQSSDWGRSKRLLDDLHQDILNYRSLQP